MDFIFADKNKKAYFFTIDLILGLSILFIGVTLYYLNVNPTFQNPSSQPINSYEILTKLDKSIGSISYVPNMESFITSNQSLVRADLSYGQQICEFYTLNLSGRIDLDMAKNLTDYFINFPILGNANKQEIPYNITVLIYENGKNATIYGSSFWNKDATYITTTRGFFAGASNITRTGFFGPCMIDVLVWY